MAYDRLALEQMLTQIPRGRVTRHGLLAAALGTTPRAVAPAVCRSTLQERFRVVMKGGWFPHQDDLEDCRRRARMLEKEGLPISNDKRRVLVTDADMWRPR
jgi:alkylated DNA nucleotide flippase Atl1